MSIKYHFFDEILNLKRFIKTCTDFVWLSFKTVWYSVKVVTDNVESGRHGNCWQVERCSMIARYSFVIKVKLSRKDCVIGWGSFGKIPNIVLPLPDICAYSAPILYNSSLILPKDGWDLKIECSKSFTREYLQSSIGHFTISLQLTVDGLGLIFANASFVEIDTSGLTNPR